MVHSISQPEHTVIRVVLTLTKIMLLCGDGCVVTDIPMVAEAHDRSMID